MVAYSLTLATTLLFALLAGILLPIPTSFSPKTRLALAFLAGLAALFSIFLVVNAWVGQQASAWWVAFAMALAHLLCRGKRLARLVDDIKNLHAQWLWPRIACQFLVLAILGWPAIREGLPSLYDGSGNNDNQQFATDSLFLLHSGYLKIPTFSAEHPQNWLTLTVTGWQPPSGRICAQEMVAWLAVLLNQNPVWIYSSFFASLAVFWSLAVALTARHFTKGLSLSPLAILVQDILIILFPSGFFLIANGNMANGFAAALSCLTLVLFRWLQDKNNPLSLGLPLFLSVFALAGTYPELVPFTALFAALACLADLAFTPSLAKSPRWWVPTAVCLLALFVYPPVTYRLVSTIQTARIFMYTAKDNPAANAFNIFANLTPAGHFATLPTMATQIGDKVPQPLYWSIALAITWSVFSLTLQAKNRNLLLGVIVTYSLATLMVLRSDYGYGWQKIHQYLASPCAAMIAAGTALLIDGKANTKAPRLTQAAGWLVAVWLVVGFASHSRLLIRISTEKAIAADHLQVRQVLRDRLAIGEPIQGPLVIHDQTFPTFWTSYFHSMWLNHFAAGLPIAYDDSGTGGGYLNWLSRKQSQLANPAELHLWGNHSLIKPGGETLLRTKLFHLVRNPQINQVTGLSREEMIQPNGKSTPPWGPPPVGFSRIAWMAAAMTVEVNSPVPGWLVVETPKSQNPHMLPGGLVSSGAPALPSGEGGYRLVVPVKAGRQKIEFLWQGKATENSAKACPISLIQFSTKEIGQP